jgi:hypothetical protein
MATMAFNVKAGFGLVDLSLGLSSGSGGLQNTSIYLVSTVAGSFAAHITTITPVTIPDGFPGLTGMRIFMDVMGTSITGAFLDVDFKIYRANGTSPIYQTPTLSVEVRGTSTNNFTLNTTVRRGGVVGSNSGRQFLAGMLGLITPADMPQASPEQAAANDEKARRCEERARRAGGLGPGAPLGAFLGCMFE